MTINMLKVWFLILITPFILFAQEPVNIGLILPLSGKASEVGEAMKNGAEMAYASLSDELHSSLKLIYEDDALIPKQTISAFRKLSSQYTISAIINAGSGPGSALAPIAEKMKIPVIAVATDMNVSKDRDYIMNMVTTPAQMAETMHAEAIRRGYKNIASVTTANEWGNAVKEAFDKSNTTLKVILDEEFLPTDRDFKPVISRIKGLKNLDAVLVLLYIEQAGLFAKQSATYQLSLPLFNSEMFEDAGEQKTSGGTLKGHWYVNPTDDPEFVKKYNETYPGASFYAANYAYDSILLIAEAIKNGQTDAEGINKYLHNFKNFSGSMGTYSADGTGAFTIPAAVKIVK